MKNLTGMLILLGMSALISCKSKISGDELKVMTLNIRFDNPQDSINAWHNRMPIVCSHISDEQPDLLGFQEVLWNQYQNLDSALSGYGSVGVGRSDGAREGELNPVFYRKDRFEVVRNLTFWLSDTPEKAGSMGWGASLPRIVTWIELVEKASHKHIYFFNTHFAHDSDTARLMSSKMLLAEIGEIAGDNPIIVTGDLNMPPTSTGYSILTGPDESVPLLRDSYVITEKRPQGPLATFNGFNTNQKGGRIDYIFIRNGMTVSSYKTASKKEKGVFISDHWPVTATVSF